MSEPKILNAVHMPILIYYGFVETELLFDWHMYSFQKTNGTYTDGDKASVHFREYEVYYPMSSVFLLNHNLKFNETSHYVLKEDIGNNVANVTFNEVTDSQGLRHTIIKFPRIEPYELEVGFTKTETPNLEKTLGEMLITNEDTVQVKNDFYSYEERHREHMKEVVMGDGSIHRINAVKDMPYQHTKNLWYEASCEFRFVSASDVEAFRKLKDLNAPFLFQPDSVYNPQKIYQVMWVSPWNVRYTSSVKGAGCTINMAVKEI